MKVCFDRSAVLPIWPCLVVVAVLSPGCTEPTFDDAGSDASFEAKRDASGSEVEGVSPVTQSDDAQRASARGDAGSSSPDATHEDARGALSSLPDDSGSVRALDRDAGNSAVSNMKESADAARPSLPDWVMPLFGVYAKRSIMVSYDDLVPVNLQGVELSLVTIAPKGSEIEVSVQLCSYRVAWVGERAPYYDLRNGSAIPAVKGRIFPGATIGAFSSDRMLQHLGFDPTRRAMCEGKVRIAAFPEQTAWLSGSTCECLTTPMPEGPTDCRVSDVDGDSKPGLTMRGSFPPLAEADLSLALDHAFTFVDGQIKADRRHTLREERAQNQSCVNPARDNCGVGNAALCPGRGSAVLIPLDAGATCAQVVAQGAFGPLDPAPTQEDCRAKGP